jgi:hypothetical protein
MDWARILAFVTGMVDQELLARIEYLAAENRILKAQLKGRLKLSDAERATLGEIGHRLGRNRQRLALGRRVGGSADQAATSLAARLPTVYDSREYVEAGGLISYGPDFPDLFRRAADYVDKILPGAKLVPSRTASQRKPSATAPTLPLRADVSTIRFSPKVGSLSALFSKFRSHDRPPSFERQLRPRSARRTSCLEHSHKSALLRTICPRLRHRRP